MAQDNKQIQPPAIKELPKAPLSPMAGDSRYHAEAEVYLEFHGWKRIGVGQGGRPLWQSPEAGKQKEELKDGPVLSELRDGQNYNFVVKQLHVPALDVIRSTEQALMMQQSRDLDKQNKVA